MIMPPKTDASLDTVIFNPNANPSSLPLNHCEIIADYATDMHSPPSPKTTRPVSITQYTLRMPPNAYIN